MFCGILAKYSDVITPFEGDYNSLLGPSIFLILSITS